MFSLSNYHRVVWIFVLTLIAPLTAGARWATLEDAPAVLNSDRYQADVRSDGSWKYVRQTEIEIRNEEGRNHYGNTTLRYNPRTTRITNLRAETRFAGRVHVVPDDLIEDKPLASTADGFDETRQISIAYPMVEIGAVLYLSYAKEATEVPIPNFYSDELEFGAELYEKKSESTITSALPLFVQKNDPRGHLEVTQHQTEGKYVIQVRLTEPIFEKVVDEEEAQLNHFATTWVNVSSSQNYSDLAKSVSESYEAVANSPLPKAYETILAAARVKPSLVEKINTVTALLAEEVRYLGDWRSTRGGHIPRSFEKILSTRFGDCKDFSVSTAALLRKMGIEANVAWVERGQRPTPFSTMATDSAFNHAIVHVRDGKNTLWIDPTNLASFAQGIFDDIINRPALIIEPKNPRLESIPLPPTKSSQTEKHITIGFEKSGSATIHAELNYRGRSATQFTGIGREMSTESINHFIAKAVAEDNFLIDSEVEPYDLTSRVTQDVNFKIAVRVKNFSMRTTAGNAYQLGRNDVGTLIDIESQNRVSDLFLGNPEINRSVYQLDNVQLVGVLPHDCKLDSPWIRTSRTFRKKDRRITIEDVREIKLPLISNAELKSEKFHQLQSRLQDCFHQIALVFK